MSRASFGSGSVVAQTCRPQRGSQPSTGCGPRPVQGAGTGAGAGRTGPPATSLVGHNPAQPPGARARGLVLIPVCLAEQAGQAGQGEQPAEAGSHVCVFLARKVSHNDALHACKAAAVPAPLRPPARGPGCAAPAGTCATHLHCLCNPRPAAAPPTWHWSPTSQHLESREASKRVRCTTNSGCPAIGGGTSTAKHVSCTQDRQVGALGGSPAGNRSSQAKAPPEGIHKVLLLYSCAGQDGARGGNLERRGLVAQGERQLGQGVVAAVVGDHILHVDNAADMCRHMGEGRGQCACRAAKGHCQH